MKAMTITKLMTKYMSVLIQHRFLSNYKRNDLLNSKIKNILYIYRDLFLNLVLIL